MLEQSILFKKMKKQTKELGELRFYQMKSLFPFDTMEDEQPEDHVHVEPPLFVKRQTGDKGAYFIGRDRYLWLRKKVLVPPEEPGFRPVALFDFGQTGGGHNSGFESLLYIDGHPYQGVDSNHQEVMLDSFAGHEIELIFMLWSGLEGGGPKRNQEHKLQCGGIGYLHADTDELYYYARVIVETLDYLSDDSTDKEMLFGAMEAALAMLDFEPECFYNTVAPALKTLKERLTRTKKNSAVTANCVGHSHIDVAWLWRLKHTREKAMRSFTTVLRLMEEYDENVFFQSQPQLYKYIKNDCPQIYEKIKERVAEGKWETDGGMWLEADCNISSGESLSRQFLYGISFFEKEFGKTATCLWLPDVFGYSWTLPQIMKLCGINTFVTTKISWNQFNTMPNDLFWWRGMDGSQVLTYFIEVPGEDDDIDSRFSTYNGMINPHSVLGSWKKFKNKELSQETLIPFGFGDGGGGPTRDMLRMRQTMDQIPGLPFVKMERVGDFLQRQHENVAKTDRPVQMWDGEFYLEYHRGTYTSQARSKKLNRSLENTLFESEALAVLALEKGMQYPYPLLNDSWEILLRNQFHDIIPGSSIHEVYEDSYKEYAQAFQNLDEVRRQAQETLIKTGESAITLFSSASFKHHEPIMIETEKEGQFILEEKPLVSQKCEGGYLVEVPLVPFTLLSVQFRESEVQEKASSFCVDLENRCIKTRFYQIQWTENGRLCRIYDKENDREVLAENGLGNCLEVYEDKPLDYENWDIDIYYTQKHEPLILNGIPELIENGTLRAVIRFRYVYRKSSFIQDMVLYSKSRRIDFITKADWQESHRLLKVGFETAIRTTKATYDIQYGHIERPNHRNTSWDVARFEVVGHKWGDLSESNYGVSLLNNCKYGYSALGNTITLSLLKSGKFPDTQADMGEHEFIYALLPHVGAVTDGDTIEQATMLNLPVRVMPGNAGRALCPIRTNSNALIVDAVKAAEDGGGIIIRMHECRGGHQSVRMETEIPVNEIIECNILEHSMGTVYQPDSWDTVWHPFEIKTFRLLTGEKSILDF